MRLHHTLPLLAIVVLSGCSTFNDFFNESYLLDSERGAELRDTQGSVVAWITIEDRQNVHTGKPFLEYRASNHTQVTRCARAWANNVDAVGGYSLGGWHAVPAGSTVLIGYINDYYNVGEANTDWRATNAQGGC